jgi:hypothetical protein
MAKKKKQPAHIYFSKADRETRKTARQLAKKCNVPYFVALRTLDNLNASAMWLRGNSLTDIAHGYGWCEAMTAEIVDHWRNKILQCVGPFAPLYGFRKGGVVWTSAE